MKKKDRQQLVNKMNENSNMMDENNEMMVLKMDRLKENRTVDKEKLMKTIEKIKKFKQ